MSSIICFKISLYLILQMLKDFLSKFLQTSSKQGLSISIMRKDRGLSANISWTLEVWSSLVGSEEPKRTTQQKGKDKPLPKAPNPSPPPPPASPAAAGGEMSSMTRPRRESDFASFPSSTPIVIDNGASTFRIGYEVPAAPGDSPNPNPSGPPRNSCNSVVVPPVQVGGRDGAARRVPQRRAEAAPPQHGYAALRLLAC